MVQTDIPKIAIARGDGIGPEIMGAVLDILQAAGAQLDLREVTIGEKAYDKGETDGISAADLKTLEECRALLKAPLNTPQGEGFGSANVMIRKRFDLFANIRPFLSLEPVIHTRSGKTDMVIIRENLEDLYAGQEYRATPDTVIGRKVVTRSETERIIRAAFEYARANGCKKITGIAKDNIQKFTDGLFHQVLDEVARDYPDIETDFYIADIGIARVGSRPQDFDAVVTQNMYGDIASDVVGEALGSIGMNGSANIGERFAMFEAVHGTWPQGAGKNLANPSGLLQAAVMMLNYLGQNDAAEKIRNAWLKTLEDGIHPQDVYRADDRSLMQKFKALLDGDKPRFSKVRAGTAEFAQAVIERLGQTPQILKPAHFSNAQGGLQMPARQEERPAENFVSTGVDIHIEYNGEAQELAGKVQPYLGRGLTLQEIQTARGDKIWPDGIKAFGSDYLTLRLMFDDKVKNDEGYKNARTLNLLSDFSSAAEPVKWREVRMLTCDAETGTLNFR